LQGNTDMPALVKPLGAEAPVGNAGKAMIINVLRTAHASVPAAIHGYRFKYTKTRQTVLNHAL
jgi:uncharacterized membrane protein YqaE (UPF0057 family)